MKEYSPAVILKAVKEASPFDLFLISFLLLPFVFNAWLGILDKLQATQSQKVWSLVAVLVLYIVGLVTMLVGSTRTRKRETARDLILTYLQDKSYTMMGFDRVRERINSSYADDFLASVITEFPRQLRFARLKGGRVGVARIVEEEPNDA